jgi:hypothetical protein
MFSVGDAPPPRRPKPFRPHTVAPSRPLRPKVKCADLDPRAILARDSILYVEPEYLNDLGFRLAKEVTLLRTEVTKYRRELRSALELVDSDIPVPYEALLVNNPEVDDEPGDIANYLAELDEDHGRLVREIRDLKLTYSDEAKMKLDHDIAAHQQGIAEVELALRIERGQIADLEKKISELTDSPIKSEVAGFAEKAKEMRDILKKLKREERDWLNRHQQLLNQRGAFSPENCALQSARHDLQTLHHIKQRKKDEIEKLAALQKYQLAAVVDAVKENRRNEHARLETALWRDNFRQQQALAEQNDGKYKIDDIKPPDGPRSSRRSVRRMRMESHDIEVSLVPEEIHLG